MKGFTTGALLCAFITSSIGCSMFVTSTDEEIVKRSVEDKLTFLVSKASRTLACVKAKGGECPAKALVEAQANFTQQARNAELKAAVVKAVAGLESAAQDSKVSGSADVTLAAIPPGTLKSQQFDILNASQQMALQSAGRALSNPTQVKLEKFYAQAAGEDDGTSGLSLTKDELRPYAKHIQEATIQDGWSLLRKRLTIVSTALRAQLQAHSIQPLSNEAAVLYALETAEAQVTLIEAYLKAYFLNGKFVSLEVDAKNLQASLKSQIKLKFPRLSDSAVDQLVAKVLHQISGRDPIDGKYKLLAKLEDGGFTTRAGAKYAFPGLSVSIDLTSDEVVQVSKIDFTAVGADIMRIALEAAGDGLNQLPVDPTSTACKVIAAKELKDYGKLRCYDSSKEAVKEDQFAKVNDHAAKVEAYAATATGQLIRGVSWLSLNNEALAKLIETAVGVVARKAAEKVSWCIYSCSAKALGSNAEDQFKEMSVFVKGTQAVQ